MNIYRILGTGIAYIIVDINKYFENIYQFKRITVYNPIGGKAAGLYDTELNCSYRPEVQNMQ